MHVWIPKDFSFHQLSGRNGALFEKSARVLILLTTTVLPRTTPCMAHIQTRHFFSWHVPILYIEMVNYSYTDHATQSISICSMGMSKPPPSPLPKLKVKYRSNLCNASSSNIMVFMSFRIINARKFVIFCFSKKKFFNEKCLVPTHFVIMGFSCIRVLARKFAYRSHDYS